MSDILVTAVPNLPVGQQPMEIVERKGLGHPDTICDAVMDAASVALCAAYERIAGGVLHHNVDKSLLVAGQTTPKLGGGTVEAPMRLVFGDRATESWLGQPIPVGEIVETAAKEWFRRHLRFVDVDRHLVMQNAIHPGSVELSGTLMRKIPAANDTSAAVGYAPLSETERIVIAAERFLNSREYKSRRPETGEDVKVMAVRRGRLVDLTVAVAFVDHLVTSVRSYFQTKLEIETELRQHLLGNLHDLDDIHVGLNTLDDETAGESGMYLTVLGTSADGADSGEVGRGNRVNGVISLNRPMTMEAAAGKNPISHVGKIYNVLSHKIAASIYRDVDGVAETYVWLCSQIGRPVDDPWAVSIELRLKERTSLDSVRKAIVEIVENELRDIDRLTAGLIKGEFPVC